MKRIVYLNHWSGDGPHALTGADPEQTPDEIEADFIRWLDRGEVRRMAELMATGGKTDKDRAAELIQALNHEWSFHGLGVVFEQLEMRGQALVLVGAGRGAIGNGHQADDQFVGMAAGERLGRYRHSSECKKKMMLSHYGWIDGVGRITVTNLQ